MTYCACVAVRVSVRLITRVAADGVQLQSNVVRRVCADAVCAVSSDMGVTWISVGATTPVIDASLHVVMAAL
jgi:hypothetical protein